MKDRTIPINKTALEEWLERIDMGTKFAIFLFWLDLYTLIFQTNFHL